MNFTAIKVNTLKGVRGEKEPPMKRTSWPKEEPSWRLSGKSKFTELPRPASVRAIAKEQSDGS